MPIISNFGNIPNASLDPSVQISDDPTNASGLGAPSILRGSVSVSKALTSNSGAVGAGQTLSVRQANYTALQAAINYAASSNKFLQFDCSTYEIDSTTALTIPNNSRSVEWHGSREDTAIIQFHQNVPVANIGDTLYKSVFDGLCFKYGVSQGPYSITGNTNTSTSITSASSTTNLVVGQAISGTGIPANTTITAISGTTLTISNAATATATGVTLTITNTNANTLIVGGVVQCQLSNFQVGDSNNAGVKGYRSVYFNSSNSEFQNRFVGWEVSFAQQDLVYLGNAGTGSLFQDWYIKNGGLNSPGAIGNYALEIPFAGTGSLLMERINFEGISGNRMIHAETSRDWTWVDTHFETITLTGFNPCIIFCSGAQHKWINLQMDFICTTAGGASGTGSIFQVYHNDMISVDGLHVSSNSTDSAATNLPFNVFQNTSNEVDNPAILNLQNVRIDDFNFGGIGTRFAMCSEMPIASFRTPLYFREFNYQKALSCRVGAVIQLTTADTAYTVYGAERDCQILVPATIAANCTITLGQFLQPSGVGSSGNGRPKLGQTVIVRWQTGTATKTLTITDQQTGTNLVAAAATAGVTYYFVYTATGYVQVT